MKLATFALTLLLSACASLAPADTSLAPIQPLTNATGGCTAWAYGRHYWVSAKHCELVGGTDGWQIAGQPARWVANSVDADITLFTGPSSDGYELARAEPPLDAEVRFTGLLFGKPELLTFRVRVMAQASRFLDENSAELIMVGANGGPGMSGAPILYKGRVVSMLTGGGLPQGHGHLIASGVPWQALRDFLRAQTGPAKADATVWRTP